MTLSDFSGLRFLVLEDEPFIRTLLKQMLRSLGSREVRGAADGTEGLQLMEEGFFPDLVVCDFQMTPMDGLSFVRRVRAAGDPARARLPMIMLTASADAEIVRAAASLGIGSLLIKPVSKQLLAHRVSAALTAPAARR